MVLVLDGPRRSRRSRCCRAWRRPCRGRSAPRRRGCTRPPCSCRRSAPPCSACSARACPWRRRTRRRSRCRPWRPRRRPRHWGTPRTMCRRRCRCPSYPRGSAGRPWPWSSAPPRSPRRPWRSWSPCRRSPRRRPEAAQRRTRLGLAWRTGANMTPLLGQTEQNTARSQVLPFAFNFQPSGFGGGAGAPP